MAIHLNERSQVESQHLNQHHLSSFVFKHIFKLLNPILVTILLPNFKYIINYCFIIPNPCGYDLVVLQSNQCTCWI